MIVLFSSCENGGVLQFVVQMHRELRKIGYNIISFVPEGAVVTFDKEDKDYVHFYTKKKSINPFNDGVKIVCKEIALLNPDLLWFFDNSINSLMVSTYLKPIKRIMIIHDAGTRHPSNHVTVKDYLHYKYQELLSLRCYKSLWKFILLSNESKATFEKIYELAANRTYVLPLGAHIPFCKEQKPIEIDNVVEDYVLFFGRIDKYKGLSTLFRTYGAYSDSKKQLIVAGNGCFTEEEKRLIEKDQRVLIINRYISDGEMIYLFAHSGYVVAPYIEATQSGIIPIAYFYGKPVIISNVPGLVQFVDDGESGIVCNSDEDYIRAYKLLSNQEVLSRMGELAFQYYNNNLEWNKNVRKMMLSFNMILN